MKAYIVERIDFFFSSLPMLIWIALDFFVPNFSCFSYKPSLLLAPYMLHYILQFLSSSIK